MSSGLLPRVSTRFRWVAAVFFVLLAIGFGLAVVVHDRFVAYDPLVARHVPSGASAFARFDLTHVMFYEPFRRSIAPLATRIAPGSGSDRTKRLEARGVRIMGDVRELLVAFGPAPGDWVVAIGGRLPADSVAPTVAELLREEGRAVTALADGAFQAGSAFFFAQAADSALILASSAERLAQARRTSAAPQELAEGAGGFVLRGPPLTPPLESARGSFRTGSVVAVEGTLNFARGTSEDDRRAARARLQALLAAGHPDVVAALQRSAPKTEEDAAQVSLRLPREAILALAERVAAAIMSP